MSTERIPKWYFGGVASAIAVVFTHPLDLIKVQLQTQTDKKMSIIPLARKLVRKNGIMGVYNGLSASIFRQLSYSTLRFAIYDTAKLIMGKDSSFASRVAVAAFAGACGGFVGTPPDKVNVRMQNDMKLPPEKRINYKHIFDGLWRIYTEEGFPKLFGGATTATVRASLMAVGQLSSYDQIKQMLLNTDYFKDNLATHFTASLAAGAIATTLAQPLDVIKTRIMNSKPGEFKSIGHVIIFTSKEGPSGFFKGYIPAFLRIGPQTILTFIFYEQLRIYLGDLPPNNNATNK